MLQNLFEVPILVLAILGGGALGASLAAGKRAGAVVLAALAGGAAAGLLAATQEWAFQALPVRGYGTMILAGFLSGVWMAARRARLIGVDPRHCMDVGIYGVIVGLAGARLFHIVIYWPDFNPFHAGFDAGRIARMFKLWEGGLVFYGAFLTVVPFAWIYCRIQKLPGLPFLDMAAPSLIAGLAFGRIGCFLNGCCYGKLCSLPWGATFPRGSHADGLGDLSAFTPPYAWQVQSGLLTGQESHSLAVHPTQIYASLAAALCAAFLYAYWPRRRYDGQILSLMLLMAGVSRFFEEILRDDEPAAFPALSPWLTIAQWIGLGIALTGVLLLCYFRQRRSYFKAQMPPVT